MARVSFTLRRQSTSPDLGSYLRYEDDVAYTSYGAGGASVEVAAESRTDTDTTLRADGLQIAPEQFAESFFDATSTCYGEVDLNWQVNVNTTLGPAPDITEVVVVYSPDGEPMTISSGDILLETSFDTFHRQAGLQQGKWAYYSLFGHYESNGGDDYYERLASLSVLVPNDYGSAYSLWNRVPAYYRLQDSLLGTVVEDPEVLACYGRVPTDKRLGPLFKYFSVIGFEIDRVRTILDHLMISRDTALANTQTLDALAIQMGTPLRSYDLGGQRLRALMQDLGLFFRSKGTLDGIEYFAKAVFGAELEIDQVNKTIKLFSQRVNYIQRPTTMNDVTHRAAGDVEYTTSGTGASVTSNALAFSDTSYSAYSGSYSVSGSQFTTTGTGAVDNVNSVMIHIPSEVPVKLGDKVGFSVHSGIGGDALKFVRVVDASENVLGYSTVSKRVDGAPAFEVEITDDVNTNTSTFTNGFVEIIVDLSQTSGYDLALSIAERNNLGSYFDGSLTRGGWLTDDDGTI